jgi:hypothetical protein
VTTQGGPWNKTMKIAATESLRRLYPSLLLPIPVEPGIVDLTIVVRHEWKEDYWFRVRQLRYIIVDSVEAGVKLLQEMGHDSCAPRSSGDGT